MWVICGISEVGVQLHFFVCEYSVIQKPFVENKGAGPQTSECINCKGAEERDFDKTKGSLCAFLNWQASQKFVFKLPEIGNLKWEITKVDVAGDGWPN